MANEIEELMDEKQCENISLRENIFEISQQIIFITMR